MIEVKESPWTYQVHLSWARFIESKTLPWGSLLTSRRILKASLAIVSTSKQTPCWAIITGKMNLEPWRRLTEALPLPRQQDGCWQKIKKQVWRDTSPRIWRKMHESDLPGTGGVFKAKSSWSGQEKKKNDVSLENELAEYLLKCTFIGISRYAKSPGTWFYETPHAGMKSLEEVRLRPVLGGGGNSKFMYPPAAFLNEGALFYVAFRLRLREEAWWSRDHRPPSPLHWRGRREKNVRLKLAHNNKQITARK